MKGEFKELKNEMRGKKGITLIALVITIIVLLILAGVTIATLTGDNGLLQKAGEAKQASDNATTDEKVRLAQAEYELEMRSNPNVNQSDTIKLNVMTNALRKAFNDDNMEVKPAGKGFTFILNEKKYKIKSDGTLSEIMDPTGVFGKLEADGTLKLKGKSQNGDGYTNIYEGVIKNFPNAQPTDIKKVIIEEPMAPNAITFYRCSNITEIESIENLHTENMTTMQGMFDICSSLKKINISSFDTSKVTSIAGMFGSCSSITEIIANNLDTSKVTDMSNMFSGCTSLVNLSVTNFDLSNVTNTSAMFNGCNSLAQLDLSTWVNTSNVGNMNWMFQLAGVHQLTELNLGKNFTIGPNATYYNILNNIQNDIHITCNSDTATKIGSRFTNVTII